MKLIISNSYNHSPVKVSRSGTGIVETFEFQKDKKTGRVKKVSTGKTNIYKLIQENSRLCGLDLLISQLKSGNVSGLDASGGLYADDKDLPKTIHDAHNLTIKASQKYYQSKILQKIYKTPQAYLDDLLDNKVKDKVDNFYNVEKARLDAEIKKANDELALKRFGIKKEEKVKEDIKLEPVDSSKEVK